MFTPLKYDSGKMFTIKDGTVSDTTIAKFDALDWASGYLQRATSATTQVRLISMEDKVTASGAHEDLIVLYVDGVEFECDTTGDMAIAYRGTQCDLTDHDTLNEDAVSVDVFYITQMIGATTDKKARGYFVMKNIVLAT